MKHLICGTIFLLCGCTNLATKDDIDALRSEIRGLNISLDRALKTEDENQFALQMARAEIAELKAGHPVAVPAMSSPSSPSSSESDLGGTGFPQASQSNLSHDVSDGNPVVGNTATGLPVHEGPRGGLYHYSKSGKKVYEKHR